MNIASNLIETAESHSTLITPMGRLVTLEIVEDGRHAFDILNEIQVCFRQLSDNDDYERRALSHVATFVKIVQKHGLYQTHIDKVLELHPIECNLPENYPSATFV